MQYATTEKCVLAEQQNALSPPPRTKGKCVPAENQNAPGTMAPEIVSQTHLPSNAKLIFHRRT